MLGTGLGDTRSIFQGLELVYEILIGGHSKVNSRRQLNKQAISLHK